MGERDDLVRCEQDGRGGPIQRLSRSMTSTVTWVPASI
jgi:hypothetical protein